MFPAMDPLLALVPSIRVGLSVSSRVPCQSAMPMTKNE